MSNFTTGDHRIHEEASHLLEVVSYTLLLVLPLYTIACVSIFFYYRNSYVWLYKRNSTMLLVFAVGALFSLYPNAWRLYSGGSDFRCVDLYIAEYFDIALLVLPFLTRLANFVLRMNFNKALIKFNFRTLRAGSFLENVGVGGDVFVSKSQLRNDNENKITCSSCLYTLFCFKPSENIPDELRMKYFLSSQRVTNIFFTTVLVILILIIVLNPAFRDNTTGCTADEGVLVSLPLFIGILIFGLFVFWSHRDIPDSIGIKHEMKLIGISLIVVEAITLPLYLNYSHYEREGVFAWSLLFYFQVFAILTISFPYQVYLARRPNHNGEEDDGITLYDILDNREGLKAFSLYAATALCIENLLFYAAVQEWKEEKDEETSNDMLMDISNSYLSSDGRWTINLSQRLRDELMQRIENNDVATDMFDEAIAFVLSLVSGDFFLRFKQSIYYQAFKGNIDAEGSESWV